MRNESGARRKAVVLAVILLLGGALAWAVIRGRSERGPRGPDAAGVWDVIVVGSEPESIAAAVAASESGARTLLITEDARLGGLFVLGELNVLDLRTQPFDYQQGFFERWWEAVGRGHAFDVERAEVAFGRFLKEARVTVQLNEHGITPVLEAEAVIGIQAGEAAYPARQVIDATADMDFASRAGAAYSVGFESLGLTERMADTLVFRVAGVDWQALRRGVRERGATYASEDDRVVWGHFGGYPAAYQPTEDGIRLRGLNIGRQDDGSVLINALLIYGIDPFDGASRASGRERAALEASRIVDYLALELPGFGSARLAGVAPGLYIRESRHLRALCTLTVDDVLDNRVTLSDVAAGGYPLDVQTLTPHDDGYVYGAPNIYGVSLCVTVPQHLRGLWVVGKAAGYDPIAASSARVVPFGMALGEAVGVAAATAARAGLQPDELVTDEALISDVREILSDRGAYLPEVAAREPVGPVGHPHYAAYRLLLSRGLAVGGYSNDPRLDQPVQAISYLYLLSNIATRFHGQPELGDMLLHRFPSTEGPLTREVAVRLTLAALCAMRACASESEELGLIRDYLPETSGPVLTRGEMYAFGALVIHLRQ